MPGHRLHGVSVEPGPGRGYGRGIGHCEDRWCASDGRGGGMRTD